jgi:hypothetical protein
MKKFIKRIIYFLIPILLFFICLEITLRKIPNDYKYKSEYINKSSSQIETLILGSSHSYYGVNPYYMSPNTFNNAHVSQSLNFDYQILMSKSKDWKKLKKIYLPISYFSFWSDLSNGLESWRSKFYYHAYDIDDNLSFQDKFFITQKFTISIRHFYNFIFKGKDLFQINDLGWGLGYDSKKSNNLQISALSASKRHSINNIYSNDNKDIFSKNVWYLNQISNWAKTNGVEVIFFTPPAHISYINNLNPEQLSITRNTISNISDKYDNCNYIDLMESSFFEKKDFFDSDHLNEKGAKKLSELLNGYNEGIFSSFNSAISKPRK